jgi:hypothetical protein
VLTIINWTLWLTAGAGWSYVGFVVANSAVRTVIFAYRMGWKSARRFRFRTWFGWFLSPPDAVGRWYWPSKSGAEMRARDEAEER